MGWPRLVLLGMCVCGIRYTHLEKVSEQDSDYRIGRLTGKCWRLY